MRHWRQLQDCKVKYHHEVRFSIVMNTVTHTQMHPYTYIDIIAPIMSESTCPMMVLSHFCPCAVSTCAYEHMFVNMPATITV